MFDLLIRNGQIVMPDDGVYACDVAVKDGRIAALLASGSTVSAMEVVDAQGLHVFPGLIDPHIHPGVYKPLTEDYPELTRFAARGGVTTLQHMLRGAGDFEDVIPQQIEAMEALGVVDFSFNPAPLTTAQVAAIPYLVTEYGITSFKFYAGYKGVEASRFGTDRTLDDGFGAELMETMAKTGADPVLMIHCENMDLAYWIRDRVDANFEQSLGHFEAQSPVIAETEFVSRMFMLGQHYGVRTYAVHVSAASTAKAAATVPWFNRDRTIMETCPHYLTLDTSAEAGLGAVVKPPLRRAGEQEGLWEAIRSGHIRTIGSDNCANPLALKTDIRNCKLGFGDVGYTLPVLLSEGHHKRQIPLERIAAITSANVAAVMGWGSRKGAVRVGADADFVLVDVEREQQVDSRSWKENDDGSVYEGMTFKGWPVATVSRGEVIVREGEYVGQAGRGRFVRRHPQ